MIEIIAVAVVGVLGFFSGWKAREETAVRRMHEILGEVQVSDDDFTDIIKIVIEHHNGVYYVYDMDDKSFMAQGKDRKELEGALASNYPGKKFAASNKNLVEVGFIS
jgi:hypothetical protein